MAGFDGALPPARRLRPYEERVRLMREVLPALTVTEHSPCGRARATVGYGCALEQLWLDWDRLREDLGHRRGPRNELVGAEQLATVIQSAVVAAVQKLLVAVNDVFHQPAPSGADLENQYYDEYWDLPEDQRPDSAEEYIRERRAASGPRPTAEQQRVADERAAEQRLAQALSALPSDPGAVLRSEPGVRLAPEVAEAKERSARNMERLRKIDVATVRFEGKDDERAPSVVVAADYSAPFTLWLHPEVFTRVGSSLGKVVPVCAAKARAKFTELVEGPDGEERDRKAV